MYIPFSGLKLQSIALWPEVAPALESVFKSGHFILGEPVLAFEKRFAQHHHRKFAISVNSGTDALCLSLRALDIGPGDEVITSCNTFITTISSIALTGAMPVLVDIQKDDNIDVEQIEASITRKTKAIMPVHWTGRPCHMDRICALAQQYNLPIIEDAAQAIGARYKGQLAGTFGILGCFSLHPGKTLNAAGDAGIIISDNTELAQKIRALRNNGLSEQGRCHAWSNNSRLDNMQAAILNIKYEYLEQWTQERIAIAAYYSEQLSGIEGITLPVVHHDDYDAVFHTYIIKIQDRDALKQYLYHHGIETHIHYSPPIYEQPIGIQTFPDGSKRFPVMSRVSKQVLSLPIYPELETAQQHYIVTKIKDYYATSLTQKVMAETINASTR